MKLFGAAWCNPCTVTKAKLDELGIVYEFIDIDTNMPLAKENGVRGIPLMITESGERFSGYETIIKHAKSIADAV